MYPMFSLLTTNLKLLLTFNVKALFGSNFLKFRNSVFTTATFALNKRFLRSNGHLFDNYSLDNIFNTNE